MMYSSAIYPSSEATLHQAQLFKLDQICQKLQLCNSDHLIEIGTGWGGLAIHAAQHYGCKVTTTTISTEQHSHAEQKIKTLGLEDKITLLKSDYRDLTGQYDKLVSIEMIEAVGNKYMDSYVKQCQSLLKPGGKMLLQAITIADQRLDYYAKGLDFIQKHIFPGGFLPSVSYLLNKMTEHTDFVLRDLHDIGLDYAQTCRHWRENFEQQLHRLDSLGYDARFARLWRFYLCYCEGGFLQRTVSAVQVVLTRPGHTDEIYRPASTI